MHACDGSEKKIKKHWIASHASIMLDYTDGISNIVSLVSPYIVYNELGACKLLQQTHKNMIIANEFLCTSPPPPADHPHSFMKWKISTQVILRRGEGFNEQELLYYVR